MSITNTKHDKRKSVYVAPETRFLPCECSRERRTNTRMTEHQRISSGWLYDIYECVECGRVQKVGK